VSEPSAAGGRPLQRLSTAGRWVVLLALSAVAAAVLECAKLPAAMMLGPLAAAVLVQAAGGAVKVPRVFLLAAQAVIGCLVARSITSSIVGDFIIHWPLFLGVVALSITASAAAGWAMSRFRIIPGTTAVWGMLPGAAPVMMLMAEAYGADFRLVAFMQYLRVVMVAAVASVVSLMFVPGGGGRFSGGYFPPISLRDLAATAILAVIGGSVGLALRVPAGVLLGPLVLGAVLNVFGWVHIELPPVVLLASFALIGWNIGLRFTHDVLAAAARALPQCLVAIVLLMAFCGILAGTLTALFHVDPLTAYLATSPGGVDAAAIIAASTKVDTPFVMALQTVRMIVLLIVGPYVARWMASTLEPPAPNSEPAVPLDQGG
jgi:membrane AbrB-like protein